MTTCKACGQTILDTEQPKREILLDFYRFLRDRPDCSDDKSIDFRIAFEAACQACVYQLDALDSRSAAVVPTREEILDDFYQAVMGEASEAEDRFLPFAERVRGALRCCTERLKYISP